MSEPPFRAQSDDSLMQVVLAHDEYRLAMAELQQRREDFIDAIRRAREDGYSLGRIGSEIGVSRQRIFTLVNDY